MAIRPFLGLNGKEDPADNDDAPQMPLGGTRAQAVQRLQVGLSGLAGVILLISLANIIMDKAKLAEAERVPEAAPTVAVDPAPAGQSDPLADAGVIPEIPASPTPEPVTAPLPPQGPAAGRDSAGMRPGGAAQP